MTESKEENLDITPSPPIKRRRIRRPILEGKLESLDTRLKQQEIISRLSPSAMASLAATSKMHEYQTRKDLKRFKRKKECQDAYDQLQQEFETMYQNLPDDVPTLNLTNQLVRDVFALNCPNKVSFIQLIMERNKLYHNSFPDLEAFRELATLRDWRDVLDTDAAEKLTNILNADLAISWRKKVELFKEHLDSVAWILIAIEGKGHREHEYKILEPYLQTLTPTEIKKVLWQVHLIFKDELSDFQDTELGRMVEKIYRDNYEEIKKYFGVKEIEQVDSDSE